MGSGHETIKLAIAVVLHLESTEMAVFEIVKSRHGLFEVVLRGVCIVSRSLIILTCFVSMQRSFLSCHST